MTTTLLSLKGVTVRYPRWMWGPPADPALLDVSLDVRPGEVVALVGGSGAGKSTVARVAVGAVPVAAGEVLVQGQVTSIAARPTPAQVQVLFQDPSAHLPPHMTVLQAMHESARVHHTAAPAAEVQDLLTQLDVWHRRHAPAAQLSGGERRRAGLARLLLARPGLLILDEPTAGLDVHRAVDALELVLARRSPTSGVLLITHDLRVVRSFADRAVVMAAGRVVESCPTRLLGQGPHHPYTAQLLHPGEPVTLRPHAPCPLLGACPQARTTCETVRPTLQVAGGEGQHQVACHAVAASAPPEA